MLLPAIHEISIVDVFDRGVPNKERILLKPTETVNLGLFGLYLGRMMPNAMILPQNDNYLWLGDRIVQPPSWIFIYTGRGQFRETKMPLSNQPAYTYHWGKPITIFDDPQIVPFLMRYSGIAIGHPQAQQMLPE
jgi:hypothetical protein